VGREGASGKERIAATDNIIGPPRQTRRLKKEKNTRGHRRGTGMVRKAPFIKKPRSTPSLEEAPLSPPRWG